MVLAEDAGEVAVGEEDGPGAVPAGDHPLLPEVRMEGGDDRIDAGRTAPQLAPPIHPAAARAEGAVAEERFERGRPPGELAAGRER